MTKKKPTLAERLVPMSIAKIDAMTDDVAAQLMGASPADIAAAVAGEEWSWKQAAKVATDEWHGRLAADIEAGRARVVTGGPELERFRQLAADELARRAGGRPRPSRTRARGSPLRPRRRCHGLRRHSTEHRGGSTT